MQSQRMPAVLMTLTAAAFAVWSVVLILSPGGPIVLEWFILGMAVLVLIFGLVSWRMEDPRRAILIRWLLTAFAMFGAVVVIGLTADDSASRTWVRLGWAALIAGVITSLLAWWAAPRVNRRSVVAGGVVAVVLMASGAGITLNCQNSLQRSWCDPAFEQEETLAARIEVSGEAESRTRAGGDTGAYLRGFLIEDTDIAAVTTVPEPFSFEERPVQSIEVARGRYTAATGSDANCQIDATVEEIPAGNLLTLIVSCASRS